LCFWPAVSTVKARGVWFERILMLDGEIRAGKVKLQPFGGLQTPTALDQFAPFWIRHLNVCFCCRLSFGSARSRQTALEKWWPFALHEQFCSHTKAFSFFRHSFPGPPGSWHASPDH
jgi:hypothetical protein